MTEDRAAVPKKVVAIGEAMIEMAPVGRELYQRGFAGDTFNTAWHMSQSLGTCARVGFVTRVGCDRLSDVFVSELRKDGMDTAAIARDADRSMGLYLIELDGVERSFSYWRKDSAACRLADDVSWLVKSIADANLIHLSGITVAILETAARHQLIDALSEARSRGAIVSFDPNIRPALWESLDEIRATIPGFLEVTDIALPSYDDERTHWGDKSPDATLDRFAAHGVNEVVVKNGSDHVAVLSNRQRLSIDTPKVADICDTTGAGDAFNAGYLAMRLLGRSANDAIVQGQRMSSAVIRNFGARIPKASVPRIRVDDENNAKGTHG